MQSERLTGLKIDDRDNVATLFCSAPVLCQVEVVDRQGRRANVTVADDIPYGHKIALQPVRKGEPIIKYGEQIGIATEDIAVGQHVHVHNVESTRGRGDREGKVECR